MSIRWDGLSAISCRSLLVVTDRLTADSSSPLAVSPSILQTMWPEPQATTGLLVDLYHLDAAYLSWRTGQNAPATFDLYTRSAPFGGAYLLTVGLEPALAFVRDFHYTEEDLAYLGRIKSYDPAFLDELRHFRFTGEILAMPEGTISFADEPLLRV